MTSRVSAAAFVLLIAGATVIAQESTTKRANIALSGCLLSQGYATFVIENARIDAVGEQAASAAPAASNTARQPGEPAKWVLDQPGNIRSYIGEKVQVVGNTEWKRGDAASGEHQGEPVPTPHVTVIGVKVLAPSCG
jgi:hypothetical protein